MVLSAQHRQISQTSANSGISAANSQIGSKDKKIKRSGKDTRHANSPMEGAKGINRIVNDSFVLKL